jgi:predicted DNA-binding WGR domain protein
MERLLHATAPEPRFWAIAVRDATITITSGPMHTPGTARHIPCKSAAAALQTAEALVAQRLKDGFQIASSPRASTLDVEAERALLRDELSGWLVFADSLMEGAERVRGELARRSDRTELAALSFCDSPGTIPKRLQDLRSRIAHFILPPRRSERAFPRAVKIKMISTQIGKHSYLKQNPIQLFHSVYKK